MKNLIFIIIVLSLFMVGCSNPASEDYSDNVPVVDTENGDNGNSSNEPNNPETNNGGNQDNPTNSGNGGTTTNPGNNNPTDTSTNNPTSNGVEGGNTSSVTENIVTFTIHNNINNSTKTITRNKNDTYYSYYLICKDELIDNNLVSDNNTVINGNLKTVTNITRNFSKLAYTNGRDVNVDSRFRTITKNGVKNEYYLVDKEETNLLKVIYDTTTTETLYTKEPTTSSEIRLSYVFEVTETTRLLTYNEYVRDKISDCSSVDSSWFHYDSYYCILEDGSYTFKIYKKSSNEDIYKIVESPDDISESHFYVYYDNCEWKEVTN